jgi:hypothetical protein
MKVRQLEKEIHSYTLTLEIEREGKSYRVDVYYDNYDGYDVYFLGDRGERISNPDWVAELEEELTEPLGFWLEERIEASV